jgi:NADPH:quinone reductase
MKAVIVQAFGGFDQLSMLELPDLVPGMGQVVIRVEVIGVGLVDVLKRRGSLGGEPGFVPGSEVAGRVVAIGLGVDVGLVGRRVFAQGSGGGYADQFLAEASSVVPIPDHLSAENAVALGVNSLVAFFSQRQSCLKAGEKVLIRGASGGVGLASVQAAVRLGATVTAITNVAAAAKIEALGVHRVVRRDHGEIVEGPFDVVIDPVGGEAVGNYIGTLAVNGRYVLLGAAAGFPEATFGKALFSIFQKSPTFLVFSMASVSPEELRNAATGIFDAAEKGTLTPIVGGVFPLSEAAEAHESLESGKVIGKILLRPTE